MERIGRTHRSVEFKHHNISAVLEELGLPWIPGYKPKRNYQNAIFDAVDRYLSTREELSLVPATQPMLGTADTHVFVESPVRGEAPRRPQRLERLVKKFDPVTRDFRNRALGKAGESFVLEVERRQLLSAGRADLAAKIRWVAAEDGDGAGFDVFSFDAAGRERLIEVKTTNGPARTPFYLTRTESEVASERADAWRLYRVHLFAQAPRIFTLTPPIESSVFLRAEAWRASWGS